MSEVRRYTSADISKGNASGPWVHFDDFDRTEMQRDGARNRLDAERLRADTAVAEVAALREELASANADKAAYAQNAIDLRTSLRAVTLNLSRADDLISKRTADLLECGTQRKASVRRNSELVELTKDALKAFNYHPEGSCYNPGIAFVKPWSIRAAELIQPTESGASE